MKPVKVVHISTAHPWDDIRILQKECATLAAAGFDVSFIVREGGPERAHGTRLIPLKKRSGRLSRMLGAPWEAYRAALREKAEIYHFHDPEFLPVAILMALQGWRVIYDAHENVPEDILEKDYLPGWLRPVLSRVAAGFEASGARLFKQIVVATPGIARHFPASKTSLVQNYPILSGESSESAVEKFPEPTFVYAGLLSRGRGVLEMLEAFQRLKGRARLLLAGTFDDVALEREMRAHPHWPEVRFLGKIDFQEVLALYPRCHGGLVLFHPTPTHLESQPTKLFEYMTHGLPTIASNFPYWRPMIEEAGVGVVVDPLDSVEIAAQVEALIADPARAALMGARGRKLALERFSWQNEAKTLLEAYEKSLA